MIRPPALHAGSRVALIAPAGPVAGGAIERAAARCRDFGWEPLAGSSASERHGYLAGTDEQRERDLRWALGAPGIDAVWCLRGGYGTMRLLERCVPGRLMSTPRPLIGFSDNTALHLALFNAGVVSFHGPHAGVADMPEFTASALLRVVAGCDGSEALPLPPGAAPQTISPGVAEGPLVGGNLALLAATLGTPYAVQTAGALLFIEDVGEPGYRIDRLLSQLRLAGIFREVAGVVAGAFSDCPDDGDPGLPTAAEVVRERLGDLDVPVTAGFPFGHIDHTWTLPLGVRARLDASAGSLQLLEPAVTCQ